MDFFGPDGTQLFLIDLVGKENTTQRNTRLSTYLILSPLIKKESITHHVIMQDLCQ